MVCSQFGGVKCAKSLLKANADPNQRDDTNKNALKFALSGKQFSIAALLLSCGNIEIHDLDQELLDFAFQSVLEEEQYLNHYISN